MDLLKLARVPAIEVAPTSSVFEAVAASLPTKSGAVVVMEKGAMIGIFTERDVMVKVVHERLDPEKTLVRDVMTAQPTTIHPDAAIEDVMKMMLEMHIRHLPISEDGKTVLGMLSIRNVLQFVVQDLEENLRHLEAHLGADGPGG